MSYSNDIETVRNYYNSVVQKEWERLDRHPIEFAVTKHYIDKYVNPGDKILDIGGGPGRYSLYLAEKGCKVTLLDLSDVNVAFAQMKAHELGLNLSAIQGDACEADKRVSGEFDAILLMGPMYHLLEEAQRAQAVSAALKLLKPGGVIFVSFISLYAGFSYYMKDAPDAIVLDFEQPYIRCYLEDRCYCGDAFTKACFISPKDILAFMTRFPLEKFHLFGQEGITSPGEYSIMSTSSDVLTRWIEIAIATCEREEFLSYPEHLMYVGRYLGGRV